MQKRKKERKKKNQTQQKKKKRGAFLHIHSDLGICIHKITHTQTKKKREHERQCIQIQTHASAYTRFHNTKQSVPGTRTHSPTYNILHSCMCCVHVNDERVGKNIYERDYLPLSNFHSWNNNKQQAIVAIRVAAVTVAAERFKKVFAGRKNSNSLSLNLARFFVSVYFLFNLLSIFNCPQT